MKPIPAIIEPAQVDVDLVAEQIIIAIAELGRVESAIRRFQGQLDDAVATARLRRLEIGRLLAKARPLYATSRPGPGQRPWSEFLERVKIDDSTAHRYMQEFRSPQDLSQREQDKPSEGNESGAAVRENPGDTKPANVNGGSGETARGAYCTPKKYAEAVGPWDLDPFSNARSHIESADSCQLERGDDGLLDLTTPGSYYRAPGTDDERKVARYNRDAFRAQATTSTRVWIQPPYEIVKEAIAHYGHTRFCALLRFDPSTDWFGHLWPVTNVVAIPIGERLEFEAPPGIETSTNPYPHAFYYADERDVTDAIRALCIVLRVEH